MEGDRNSRLAPYRRVRSRSATGADGGNRPSRGRRKLRSEARTPAERREEQHSNEQPHTLAATSRTTGPTSGIARRRTPKADASPTVTGAAESGAMATDRAVQTRKEEEMRHPAKVWADPAFEQESLERLRQEFKRNNLMGYGSSGRKLSIRSVEKYDFTLEHFMRSLERHAVAPVLGALTPDNVAVWQRDQELRGNSPHGIAGRVISLKVFSNKFVFKTLELTTVDLLRKVERPNPKLKEPEVLSSEEITLLLEAYDRDRFEDIRDRAFLAVFAATGLRYRAVLTMKVGDYDRVTGAFTVHEKGDEDRPAQVDGRARRFLNHYLARRPRTATTEQLWVTDMGTALSYWGGQMIIRRARERTGIARLHSHLFRHGIAHRAADQGARLMPQYSPI